MKLRGSLSRASLPVLFAAGALLLAACGSSGGSAGTSSSSGAAAASGSAAPVTAGGYKPVSNYAAFIGGSGKANSSLSPIEIGVTNEQGGSDDIAPQWTNGTTLAADYINNQAGGIDGHPVKLVDCFIPDQVSNAAQCGEEFANNSAIPVVAVGAVAIGNEALESAMAATGKVAVFGVSVSPTDTVYKYGFILYGDGTHVEAPIATFIKQYLHSKSVAIVYPNLPGANVGVEIIADALKYEGIPSKVVAYDPSTTNLTAPFIAAGAATTGLIVNDAETPQQCSATYEALKQLNITTPVLVNVPCDNSITAQGDGGQLPVGWYYASANPLPGDAADPSLAAFKKVADKYGDPSGATDAWTADAFGQVVTIAKLESEILKHGAKITPATVDAAFKAFKGPLPQGAPSLDCGQFSDAPAVCNDRVSFFQNTSPGVFKAIARWIFPPAGFVAPKGLE